MKTNENVVVEVLNKIETVKAPEKIEAVTSTKTTSLKVVGNDNKLRLFSLFDQFTSGCSKVKDKMYDLKSDETTEPAYNDYVKQMSRGRGCATTLFTEKSEGEYAKKYRSLDIFPIYKQPKKGFNLTSAGYHYSANAAVHIQLDSLNECDKLCNAEFNKLKKEVERFDEQLHESYDGDLVDKFYAFIEKTILKGWSFDINFQKFFVQCMLPELREGRIITKGTYKIGDKSKRYSFYQSKLADIIAANPQFWQIMSDENSVNYFDANRLLQRKKEHAEYTKTTLLRAPVRPIFGNNGINFSISSDNEYVYMSFRLPSLDGAKPELINIPCACRKFYDGKARKSCYLDGLTIEQNGKGKYICKYSINGKHPQSGELKELFLRLVIKNHEWFNKYINGTLTEKNGLLQSSYFDLYFDLSLGITEPPIHNLTASDVFGKKSLRSFYSSSWPEIKDLGNQKSVDEKFVCPIDKSHNLMGIDLGQRNPFAYCVKDNNGLVIASGHLDGANNDNYKKYIEFGNQCERLIQLIKETKNYLYGDDEAVDPINFNTIAGEIDYGQYLEYLKSKRSLVNVEDQSKNQTHTMRVDRNWIVKESVWQLNIQYHALNKGRYTDNDWRQTLYWIDAIYRFIDLQKTYHNFGSYYDHKTKTKINGTGKGFCLNYWEHINNLNRDTFKKFTYELLPIIKKYGVSVICLEELRSMYGDRLRSTNDNRLYNLWPVGQLKTFLEGILTPYNVAVIEVSEQDTSQIIDGKWAKRDRDILTIGYKTVHADEQAASNIVDRALTHHTNLYSLYMVNPMDNYWVPNQLWSPKEIGGKRVRGFLTKIYGTSNVVLIKQSDNKLVKSEITVKELKKIVGKKKLVNKDYMYRINDVEWVDGEDKELIIKSVGEYGSGQTQQTS